MLQLDRETDPEILRKAALILETENKRLISTVLDLQRKILQLQGKGQDEQQLRLRLAELEQQLAVRNRKLFGDSSEKRGHQDSDGSQSKDKKPKTGHGPRSHPKLRLIEQSHDLDEPDKTCPQCGGQLHPWEGQTEDSEEIDVITREFVVIKHKRKKYTCKCGACVETAPAPIKLFPGARYSVNFAIEVALAKYLDHLPLERQVRSMCRDGLQIDSQTLWDQIDRLARQLDSPYARILGHIMSCDVVGADETTWKMLGGKQGSKTWRMWAVGSEHAVYYVIQDSRSLQSAINLLGDYEGTIVCDGYQVYEALAARYRCIVLANCWAHVRRKYFEIEGSFPDQVAEILAMIAELYAIENLCPVGPPGDQLRAQLRTERSRPLVQRIWQWATTTPTLPQSGLGKAIAYMLGIWQGLTRFLNDPQVPLDNNRLERAIRGPVVGRKNHYGSRSERGTKVAAVFYTLIETAKLVGVDPRTYLRTAVLAALTGQPVPLPHELLPASQSDTQA